MAYFPELKATPKLPQGITRDDLRRALVDAYQRAGVPPARVFLQSFDPEDLRFWRTHAPAYARNAIWLDGRRLDSADPATWNPTMPVLVAGGLRPLGPPIRYLLANRNGQLRPTAYARAACRAGLRLVPWILERTGWGGRRSFTERFGTFASSPSSATTPGATGGCP